MKMPQKCLFFADNHYNLQRLKFKKIFKKKTRKNIETIGVLNIETKKMLFGILSHCAKSSM